jgi:transcriptional regulator with XRE-family HTH domain
MPSRETLRGAGIQQADYLNRQLGREARHLRIAAGLSQAEVARVAGMSRGWLHRLEHGRLRSVDMRRLTVLFAFLGHKLVAKPYPTGEPLRDRTQLRLLERFNARVPPAWRRRFEAVMPSAGDLRAWDELLIGPVSIGVEAETKPRDLQGLERGMAIKKRDSKVDRMILLVSSTDANRALVRAQLGVLRQTFPLNTRETLSAWPQATIRELTAWSFSEPASFSRAPASVRWVVAVPARHPSEHTRGD